MPYIPYIEFIAHNDTILLHIIKTYIIHTERKEQTMQNVKHQTRNKGKANKIILSTWTWPNPGVGLGWVSFIRLVG